MLSNIPHDILVVDHANSELINSNENIFDFDLKTISLKEVQKFTCPLNFKITDPKLPISSLCLWFTVKFPGSNVLDTSPQSTLTHWKQAFVYFPKPISLTEPNLQGSLIANVDTHLSYRLRVQLDESNEKTNKITVSSWGIKYI